MFDATTKRGALVEHVKDALAALPAHFLSSTNIEGLDAGDLFSLNTMLGSSIEVQVVRTLNRLRDVWDPDDEWQEYEFVRSSQTFPDVRLVTQSPSRIEAGEEVVLGLELKGWYLLSREGEPSFRYAVAREVCDPHDLLVVVPWHLSNVLSGLPVVYAPYVESARYAADMRDYYWSVQRKMKDDAAAKSAIEAGRTPKAIAADYYAITSPAFLEPYPKPKAKVSNKAKQDGGKNYGRVARTAGLMDEYVNQQLGIRVAGIEARHWVGFFSAYAEGAKEGELDAKISNLLAKERIASGLDSEELVELLRKWQELRRLD